MKIFALEGPSLAGKSTVMNGLKSVLADNGLSTSYIRCYADILQQHNMKPITVNPVSCEEQLLNVMAHVGLELVRRRDIPTETDIVILDRSLWTCLAHTWALAMTDLIDARELVFSDSVLELLRPLLPNHVFYLELDQADVAQRHARRADLPDFLASDRFNGSFQHFFMSELGPKSQTVLAFEINPKEKAISIAETIERMLE